MYFIYTLIDPISNEVKYVGCSKNPKNRYKSHVKESIEKQNTPKKAWIFSLLQRNRSPKIKIIDQTDCEIKAREFEEKYCIQYFETILNQHNPKKGKGDFKREGTRG